jgi:predicted amidophosphoribosyltransferase
VEALAREALVRFWPGGNFGAVVPVPCHPTTLRRRGAGLPAQLARAVAREAGAPWRPTALEKARAVPELVGLDAEGRAAAVQGAYRPREPLAGTVLLVDDVATSTATARACAQACREAGALRVCVLALARTPLHEPSRAAEGHEFSFGQGPSPVLQNRTLRDPSTRSRRGEPWHWLRKE